MPTKRNLTGFTLIELMVVVAIVAVLAAVAYPSYIQYIVRSNRAAAEGYMLEVTSLQQRYLLDARTYAGPPCPDLTTAGMTALGASPPSTVSANYSITTCAPTPITFAVTATPIGGQLARDAKCGSLSIDQAGTKSATGSGGVATCWQQ